MSNDDDLQQCEHCDNALEIDHMTMSGDVWLCPACVIEWDKTFDACQHKWEPGHHDGEAGQFCPQCSGFVEQAHFDQMRDALSPQDTTK